jgi:squalene-hopene/tetraprenyl-beta-curcumene cyclase
MMDLLDHDRLERAYQTALAALLAERTPEGHWVGELSTSALSTAVAVSALGLVQKATPRHGSFDHQIAGGLRWLAAHQNDDGGWGDTVVSFSNISTTMLCRAAFHLSGAAARFVENLERADKWLHERYGNSPEELAEAVRKRYGKDRTFSVPILMTSALAGLVAWKEVPSLPFELACFPQSWFRFIRLPVVSYALPALIAIGQAVYHHRPPWNPVARLVRWLARGRSLRVLEKIQPSNGGFLEATPLTSFVTLGLASIGQAAHPVAAKAVSFIVASVRPDGSWPIDTNLSTWVTTLSINALAAAGDLETLDRLPGLHQWLTRQQYRERHPYTDADPGAFAWTPLPGGVPDADDTPGAILAIFNLEGWLQLDPDEYWYRWGHARNWLRDLQNADGGWPTFCRGWGALPFDRSGTDLTAHAIRAFVALGAGNKEYFKRLYGAVVTRGLAYLARQQRPDGSWLPLWFGNQHAPDDENPTYGTARVLAAYRDLGMMESEPARRGVDWLLSNQNEDGGWGAGRGTPTSVEETALAVEVLVAVTDRGVTTLCSPQTAMNRGLFRLVQLVERGALHRPTPIGFYFAKLWYYEKLYPIIFSVAALGRARKSLLWRDQPTALERQP